MARIAQCIHELCVKVCSTPPPKQVPKAHHCVFKGIHVTKRDLFYTDVKLFEKQTASDAVLEEMGCMFASECELSLN